MKPTEWVVTWAEFNGAPAGELRFTERARARGFLIMRKALGFSAFITARGY